MELEIRIAKLKYYPYHLVSMYSHGIILFAFFIKNGLTADRAIVVLL